MEREFQPLVVRELGLGAGFCRPVQLRPAHVTPDSPAREVMTDLSRVSPATIRPQAPVSGAHHYMISRGVRLLLVVDDHESILGVVTATDILGERPMLVARERGLRVDEQTVADVMTPAERVQVMSIEDVEAARVGHIVATLRHQGRQHALVMQADGDRRRALVRGIFSLTQIARQLGVTMQPTVVAGTFAEIEAVLSK